MFYVRKCVFNCWKGKTERTHEERIRPHEGRVRDAAPMNKVSIKECLEFPWKLQEDEDQQRQRGDANEEEEQI